MAGLIDAKEPGTITVAPSILSADFADLAHDMAAVKDATDWLHIDVMDGHFVPNLTLGPAVVEAMRARSDAHFDCHLMVSDPGEFLEAFRDAGASSATVHVEVGRTKELIEEMRGLGLGVGVACNPDTELQAVEPYVGAIDLLLIMTVVPGFGGQAFIEAVVPKIEAARMLLDEAALDVVIEVDGGIDADTGARCVHAGARILVAGSAVFGKDSPKGAVEAILDAGKGALEAAARRADA